MVEQRSQLVVIIGDVNVDWVIATQDTGVPISQLRRHGRETIVARIGGSGAILATAFRAAGIKSCLVACVGDDPYGQDAFRILAEDGVHLSVMRTRGAGTGKVLIIESTEHGGASKAMVSHRGANVLLVLDDRQRELLASCSLLVVSGYALLEPPQSRSTLAAIRACESAGIPRFLDVVPHEIVRDALPNDYRDGLELCDGISIELGTARALLGLETAGVEELLAALQREFRLVILRPDNDTQMISLAGQTTVETTGYSHASDRTGYLDRATARVLASLLMSGRF